MAELRVLLNDKVWDKAAVHALLDTNPKAVGRALMTVYGNQTRDEQASEQTKHHNGIGFTGRDAKPMTDIAKKWQRYGRWASEKQLSYVRNTMKKYHRQILEEIATKPGAVVLSRKERVVEPTAQQVEDDVMRVEANDARSFYVTPEAVVKAANEIAGSW